MRRLQAHRMSLHTPHNGPLQYAMPWVQGGGSRGATGTPARPINDSKGCGGVMRVAPIGLVREYTVAQAFEVASRAAAQTHGHPEGYLPAGALAAIVRALVEGLPLPSAVSEAVALLREQPRSAPIRRGGARGWIARRSCLN